MSRWVPVYIGVGSNLDAPLTQVRRAFHQLTVLPGTSAWQASRCYVTQPLGPVQSQPDFVNAVAAALTTLSMDDFFAVLRQLETALGRRRDGTRWGPRHIDLDLLVYGTERRDTPDLRVPHPAIVERAFVLYPLCDVAPELWVPGAGRVSQLKARVDGSGVTVAGPL